MRSIGEWELTHAHRATGVLRASGYGSTPRIGLREYSAHRATGVLTGVSLASVPRRRPVPAYAKPHSREGRSRLGAFAFPLRRIRIPA
jgi:hypothetical protein